MTTLSDMVMQCGGGGCCVLEQCFQYPRRAREPRDCGCQFALLHRADIAWPSVHVKISILSSCGPTLHAGEKSRVYRGSHSVFLLLVSHPHTRFLVSVWPSSYPLFVCIFFCLTFESTHILWFSFQYQKLKIYLIILITFAVYSDLLHSYLSQLEYICIIN